MLKLSLKHEAIKVSVPAGNFKGVRYDFKYNVVGTEKSQTPLLEQTFVLVKNVGIVYHRFIKDGGSFKSLLTDYHVSDKK